MSGTNTAHEDPNCYFGCNWRHAKTGHDYTVVCFAIAEASLTPVVVYQSIKTGEVWTRPCSEFFDGRFQQRPIQSVTTGTNL